jgi:hypothetical protein
LAHIHEIKVRLTENAGQLLRRRARALDIPPSVLARLLLVRGLMSELEHEQNDTPSIIIDGSPGEGLCKTTKTWSVS